jgi:hypothetical protein
VTDRRHAACNNHHAWRDQPKDTFRGLCIGNVQTAESTELCFDGDLRLRERGLRANTD